MVIWLADLLDSGCISSWAPKLLLRK